MIQEELVCIHGSLRVIIKTSLPCSFPGAFVCTEWFSAMVFWATVCKPSSRMCAHWFFSTMESWEAGLWPSSHLSLQTSPVILNSDFPFPLDLAPPASFLETMHGWRNTASETRHPTVSSPPSSRSKSWETLGELGKERCARNWVRPDGGALSLDPANKDECVCTKAWRSPLTTHRQATKPL